jgi:putative inorganic carbon (hco3(-)) transporter
MAERAVWRVPTVLWALFGVVALVAIWRIYPERLEGSGAVLTPVAIAFTTILLRRLWQLPPAITMSIALVLTVFSGGWKFMGLGGLPVNRLFVLFALLQIFLRAPGVVATPRLRLRPVHLMMAVALCFALASGIASGTLASSKSLLLFLDVFGVTPFLLYLVAPSVFSHDWERDLLLATLVGIGAYLGVTAIFECLGPHSLVFPHYIALADAETPGELKAGGPFQSTVAEGFATFTCAVAAVIALSRWRDARARAFAVLVTVVCGFGCFLTLERGVWLAAGAAIVVTALMTRRGRALLVPGAALLIIVLIGALTVFPQLSERTSARASYDQSIWDRKNQTAAGIRMIEAKPLTGFGFDRYETDAVDYFRQDPNYPMTGYTHSQFIVDPPSTLPLHDTYLAYAVELGLIGLTLWLGSVLWAVGEGIFGVGPPELRPWKLGLLAISVFFLVVSVVDPHTAPFPMVALLVWAGVATGHRPAVRTEPRASAPVDPALAPG